MKKQIAIILISLYPMYACNLDSNKNQVNSNTSSSTTITTKNMVGKELEKYCNNVYCAPISKQEIENPKLDKPFDVAVSSDGKKVFVLNKIDKEHYSSCFSVYIQAKKMKNPRQYIYEITEGKKISVLKVNGEYPFSCQMGNEIEKDKNDNIYIVRDNIDPIIKFNDRNQEILLLSNEIYKITPEKSINKVFTKDTEFLHSSLEDKLSSISNLRITNDSDENIYFTMFGGFSYGTKEKLFMNKKGELKELLSNITSDGIGQPYSADFLIDKNKLIYPDLTSTDIPYGSVKKVFSSENGDKLYPDAGKIIPIGNNTSIFFQLNAKEFDSYGNIYGISSYRSNGDGNSIWKVTPKGELMKIAGNSTAGYKDGKGEEALFNNPSNLSIDAQGNVYVADTGNNAIRKITPDGMVSTFYKND